MTTTNLTCVNCSHFGEDVHLYKTIGKRDEAPLCDKVAECNTRMREQIGAPALNALANWAAAMKQGAKYD